MYDFNFMVAISIYKEDGCDLTEQNKYYYFNHIEDAAYFAERKFTEYEKYTETGIYEFVFIKIKEKDLYQDLNEIYCAIV